MESIPVSGSWLSVGDSHQAEYADYESVVTKITVINYSGERALSMMDKYYSKIRGNSDEKEKQRQDLLQVVQHYRKENPDLLKASLAKI